MHPPRTIIFDLTRLGGDAATGQLKEVLFRDWPRDRLMQVYGSASRGLSVAPAIDDPAQDRGADVGGVVKACARFRPQVLYCRPVDQAEDLHQASLRVADELGVPIVTHLMDDWPERLRAVDPAAFARWDADLRQTLRRSTQVLSICDAMSAAFESRYGVAMTAVANAVDVAEWEGAPAGRDEEFVLLYAGALAADMTLASVADVALAVAGLRADGHRVRLDIATMPGWQEQARSVAAGLDGVVLCPFVTGEAYRRMLRGAGALLIAYNFDESSTRYVRYSLANRTPEYLASGVPILAYGPAGLATIDYLQRERVASVVAARGQRELRSALRRLAENEGLRADLAARARRLAAARHDGRRTRARFRLVLARAAADPRGPGLPAVLVLDPSRVGSDTATGQAKRALFGGWPDGRLMQVFGSDGAPPRLARDPDDEDLDEAHADADSLAAACRAFRPDVIYARPVESATWVLDLCERLERETGAPVVVHLMDDWPERLRAEDPERFAPIDARLRGLLRRGARALSICDAMSEAFAQRYRVPFEAAAGGVDEAEWRRAPGWVRPPAAPGQGLLIRYCGALAQDMTLQSVLDVADAVDHMHERFGIRLEVYTMDWCLPAAREALKGRRGVRVEALVSRAKYPDLLLGADALLIAYNFDAASVRYTRYSLANKLPDCLVAGAPILAYGPRESATIDYLSRHDAAEVVRVRNPARVREAIHRLLDPARATALGERARALALERHTADTVRTRFRASIRSAAGMEAGAASEAWNGWIDGDWVGPLARGEARKVDEAAIVRDLVDDWPDGPVLVDVGAHQGSSARPYLDAGWRVLAFEPDPANRERLEAALGRQPGITIDPRAVADEPSAGRDFYASPQSTGISGLAPFHDTHVPVARVPVTTLEIALREHGVERIDFLKVDTEGFDLMVLRGLDWSRFQPRAVLCEFEDAKTSGLGYTVHDLAAFLVERGYSVLVSEWHPVVRYGVAHDWRRLVPYPCRFDEPSAWGNLVALRQRLPKERVVRAFAARAIVSRDAEPAGSAPIRPAPVKAQGRAPVVPAREGAKQPMPRDVRRRVKERLLHRHATLVEVIRFGLWSARTLARKPVAWALLTLAVGLGAGAFASPASWRPWMLGGAAGVAVLLFAALAAGFARLRLGEAAARFGQAEAELARALRAFELRFRSLEDERLRAEREVAHAVDARMAEAVRQLAAADETSVRLVRDLGSMLEEVRGSVAGETARLARRLSELASAIEKLDARVGAMTEEAKQAARKVEGARRDMDRLAVRQEHQHAVTRRALGSVRRAAERADHHASEAAKERAAAKEIRGEVESIRGEIADLKSRTDGASVLARTLGVGDRQGGALRGGGPGVARRLHSLNSATFQSFNRLLGADEIARIVSDWLPALGLRGALDARALGYMAHKICLAEDACAGRLATDIESMMLRALAARAVRDRDLEVLEIGALFGIATGAIYDQSRGHFESIHLTLIDPFEGYYGRNNLDPVTRIPVTLATCVENLRRLGVPDESVTIIQDYSTAERAIASAARRTYNLLVVDGDHSRFGVASDYVAYRAMVRRGGFIIFDDYDTPDWSDVKDFVDAEVRGEPRLEFIGAQWRTAVFRVLTPFEAPAGGLGPGRQPGVQVTVEPREQPRREPRSV